MSKARKGDPDPDMREEYDFTRGIRGKYAGRVSPLRVELKMEIRVTAVIQETPEGYVAYVEELPGANTQGATFEEAQANLEEAIALVLEANRRLGVS
jgi:predicted RNase H-like HicB family nuclease